MRSKNISLRGTSSKCKSHGNCRLQETIYKMKMEAIHLMCCIKNLVHKQIEGFFKYNKQTTENFFNLCVPRRSAISLAKACPGLSLSVARIIRET